MKGRHIPLPQQRARSAELDAIRTRRPLTDAERQEADTLAYCAYLRTWRAVQAEQTRRLRRPHLNHA